MTKTELEKLKTDLKSTGRTAEKTAHLHADIIAALEAGELVLALPSDAKPERECPRSKSGRHSEFFRKGTLCCCYCGAEPEGLVGPGKATS